MQKIGIYNLFVSILFLFITDGVKMISIDARWDSNRGAQKFTHDLANIKALCWKPCLAIVKENLGLSFGSTRLELVTGSGFG